MVIWTDNKSYHNCYHQTYKTKLVVYLCWFRKWIDLLYERVKKQLFSGVLQNTSSENFFKIRRKTWDKAFLLGNLQAYRLKLYWKRFQYCCFTVKFAMFFTAALFQNTTGRLPLTVCNIATGGPSFYHNKTKIIHHWYFRYYSML